MVSPYRPKRKRDPRVRALFWQGVYYGLAVGLLAGVGTWAFLLLGGAPLWASQSRAAVTVIACGLFGAAAVCSWVWGFRGLGMAAGELVSGLASRMEWFVWAFVHDTDEDVRAQRVVEASEWLVRAVLGGPAGVPLMLALIVTGRAGPFSPWPLGLLSVAAGCGWLSLVGAGWQWLVGWRPPQPPQTAVADYAAAGAALRQTAETDSALQLAVAKAKRLRAAGKPDKAIQLLETALRDAMRHGRSTAHLQLHWLLAWLYADTGNVDGAIVMFRIVRDLAEPGSEYRHEAEAAIQRLVRRNAAEAPRSEEPTQILGEDLRGRR